MPTEPSSFLRLCIVAVVFCCAAISCATFAATSYAIDEFENKPIEYSRSTPDNCISQLQARLDRGEVRLSYDAERFGYLQALLDALKINADSQTLVFSKTSKQRHRISPRTPRAIYFNDDAYVGYCVEGDILEISVADPHLGAVFYTLDQDKSDRPMLVRETDNCLICHASSRIGEIPGHLIRSLYVDARGEPMLSEGSRSVDHTTPLAERWGGWYVTGTHGEQRHLGNFIVRKENAARPYINQVGHNVTDLSDFINVKDFLAPHSDLIALMVLEHQTLVHNRLTEAGFAARQALHYEVEFNHSFGEDKYQRLESTKRRITSAGDKLVAALLFVDEAKLEAPLVGTSSFSERFAKLGPRDDRGRSLRDFDLQTRMFRYPCSYLIYSRSFDDLPPEMKSYVAKKLLGILRGSDDDPAYRHLTADDRRALIEILAVTKPDLKAAARGWKR